MIVTNASVITNFMASVYENLNFFLFIQPFSWVIVFFIHYQITNQLTKKKRQVPETKPNDLFIFISGLIVHIQIGTDTTMVNGYKQRTKKTSNQKRKKNDLETQKNQIHSLLKIETETTQTHIGK